MTMPDLAALTLDSGAHESRDDGVCLMELVAWETGEEHTDHPKCVSPVLGAFGRPLNDALPDDLRQELKQFRRRLIGTAGDGLDACRGYLALDWLIRTWTPAWLDLAGLTGEASALRDMARITSVRQARAAGPVVRDAREKAAAAGAAARAAARDAAGAAAWAAARDAAGDRLAPTVLALQRSAITLYDQMITGQPA